MHPQTSDRAVCCLQFGFRFHVSLQIDQNSPFVVVRSGSVRSKFYSLREFLQRTLEIKLIGESYTQIQVCIRRPRIKARRLYGSP